MTPPAQLALIGAAGVAAGAVNAVVGSGSLLTFPALLAAGLPPVVANVSNNVGLVAGNLASAVGYRRELAGQWRRIAWLGPLAAAGGLAGAVALLQLPPRAFRLIVPVLILAACVLVVAQPWLAKRLGRRDQRAGHASRLSRWLLGGGVAAARSTADTSVPPREFWSPACSAPSHPGSRTGSTP